MIQDMRERDAYGRELYGQPLRAEDGRDSDIDAYQEILDLAAYMRKGMAEREARRKLLADHFTELADSAQRMADVGHIGHPKREAYCQGQAHAFRFAAKTITEGIKS